MDIQAIIFIALLFGGSSAWVGLAAYFGFSPVSDNEWVPRIKCYDCGGDHDLADIEIEHFTTTYGGREMMRFECPGEETDDKA